MDNNIHVKLDRDGDGVNTLRAQLLVWGVMLVLLPALFIFFIFLSYEMNQTREVARMQLEASVRSQSETIEHWLGDYAEQIRRLAQSDSVRSDQPLQTQQQFTSVLLGMRDFSGIYILDHSGKVVGGTVPSKDIDIPAQSVIEKYALAGQVKVSDVIFGQAQVPYLFISAPVEAASPQGQATVLGVAKLSNVFSQLEKYRYGKTGEIYLLNADGSVLSRSRAASDAANPPKSEMKSEGWRQGISGRRGMASYENYLGKPVYGVFNKIAGPAWIIISEIQETETLDGLYSQMRAMAGAVGVILLVALGLSYWGARRIERPILELTDAARHIREGNFGYQLETEILSRGPLETRELCYTFARMAERINMQIRSMERANESLARNEERWQLALKGNKDGIWDWNLSSGTVFLSDRSREIFAFLPDAGNFTREKITAGIHSDDLPKVLKRLEEHLKGEVDDYEVEYRWMDGGKEKWILDRGLALRNEEGIPVRMAGSHTDITERKQMEEKLVFYSMRDALTGLYNRAYFEEELQRLNDGRYAPVGVIVCDVDGLKLFNDSFGHNVGDRLLQAAADVLTRTFRTGDVIARVGGDEFAIILPRVTQEVADQACARLQASIEQVNANNSDFLLSISVGVAISEDETVNLHRLLREADNKMYKEKLLQSQTIRTSITRTVVQLLEARDYVAQGHTRRVAQLCAGLAGKLGLPEDRIQNIEMLAEYHDIGKVGVSDQILFKNGRLNPIETKEMQRHCEIGHRIALSASELSHLAEFILKHQEWWNGNGYPLGISGEEIPLECRILAIVDAYDAMVSERPYRGAMSHDEAAAELKRCAGSQFDPFLVGLFLELEPNVYLEKSSKEFGRA